MAAHSSDYGELKPRGPFTGSHMLNVRAVPRVRVERTGHRCLCTPGLSACPLFFSSMPPYGFSAACVCPLAVRR